MRKSYARFMDFPSVIELFETVLNDACAASASDIHLCPGNPDLLVRLRVHGALRDVSRLPMQLHPELLARIKILAQLRIDEHLMPQDGRFSFELPDGARVDVRVSLTPTHHGEQAVLRLLRLHAELETLKGLGLRREYRAVIEAVLGRQTGLVLVTGPTGSGKTSTLYALLRLLNTRDISIMTIEDPVEYEMPGVAQISVHPAAGFSFAHALRSVMRQDPDVIMVGEIRDRETAELAIHAALTGHLVLATFHANDAPAALLRLITMGVEPYLVASTVELVLSQRLVRTKDERARIGIFELLRLNAAMREVIARSGSKDALLACADNASYWPLAHDCQAKLERNLLYPPDVQRYL